MLDADPRDWSSVWFFRTFEERSYHSIDHTVGRHGAARPSQLPRRGGQRRRPHQQPLRHHGPRARPSTSTCSGRRAEVVQPTAGHQQRRVPVLLRPAEPARSRYLSALEPGARRRDGAHCRQVHELGTALDGDPRATSAPAYGPGRQPAGTRWTSSSSSTTRRRPASRPLYIKQARPYPGARTADGPAPVVCASSHRAVTSLSLRVLCSAAGCGTTGAFSTSHRCLMSANLIDRREYKYLIDASTAAAVRSAIRPFCEIDPWAAKNPRGVYTIESIYLDTRACRCSGPTSTSRSTASRCACAATRACPAAPVFFEVKRRVNDVISKSRRQGAAGAVRGAADQPGGCDPRRRRRQGPRRRRALPRDQRRMQLRPFTMVRYERRAVLQPHRRLRARHLRHGDPGPGDRPYSFDLPSRGWRALDDAVTQRTLESLIVLELKFTAAVPLWLVNIVERLGLSRRSFSKYGTSIRAHYQQLDSRTSRYVGGLAVNGPELWSLGVSEPLALQGRGAVAVAGVRADAGARGGLRVDLPRHVVLTGSGPRDRARQHHRLHADAGDRQQHRGRPRHRRRPGDHPLSHRAA